MIRLEEIEKLSIRYQTSPVTIAREYCQHNILSSLYTQKGSGKLLFKGGTALRVVYKSPRFSEDLDFTGIYNISYYEIEDVLTQVLSDLDFWGFDIDLLEAKKTRGGYLSKINFSLYEYKFFIQIEISFRQIRGKIKSETSSIKNDYIHIYSIIHLPLSKIVDGKIMALLARAKARDWYDIYFLLHNNMFEVKHKKKLAQILDKAKKTKCNFKKELKDFLPLSHQMILKDFKNVLVGEIEKHV